MNKRQIKKSRKVKENKVRSVIKVDLTNVSDNAHIDIYISNRFEAKSDNEQWMSSIGHDKKISVTKALARGKDCVIRIENGWNKKVSVTSFLSDTDKSYYVIKPNKTVEELKEIIKKNMSEQNLTFEELKKRVEENE